MSTVRISQSLSDTLADADFPSDSYWKSPNYVFRWHSHISVAEAGIAQVTLPAALQNVRYKKQWKQGQLEPGKVHIAMYASPNKIESGLRASY